MSMRWLRCWIFTAFLLAAALWSPLAAAAPSAQDRERARGYMDLGDEKSAAGDLEGALAAYVAADGIMGVPTTGLEVGRALEKLGRLIEARDAFVRVTRVPRAPGESPLFTAARDKAAELAGEIGARIPQLTLTIKGLPEGVHPEVTLDGNPLRGELLALPVKVNPGKVRVVASAPGFLRVEREETVAERETKAIELAFQADPGARATTPVSVAPTAPAARTEAPPKRTLMWVAFGAGAAGLVTGSVTGILSLSKTDAAKAHCEGKSCSEAAEDDIDTATTLANVANVGFAVAVVGAGVGVWQLLVHREAPKTARSSSGFHAEARVGLGTVGVAGTF